MPAAAAISSTVVSSKPLRANSANAAASICPRVVAGGRPAPRRPSASRSTPALWTLLAPCANIWRMTAAATERTQAEPVQPQPVPSDDDLVLADLLVEEISIDGMCGVY